MTFSIEILKLAEKVVTLCKAQEFTISTAESCTGGLVSGAITEIAGSSKIFTHGFVTYSNKAKVEILGVSEETLNKFGAVSHQVVKEMAEGALDKSKAQISLSVSGVAGPDGSEMKPVGLVFIGLSHKNIPTLTKEFKFGNFDRATVRSKIIEAGLEMVLKELSKKV